MGSKSSTTQASELTTTDNTKSNDTFLKRTSDDDIYRLAIDQSGVIGSFYDARQDCLLKNLSLQILCEPKISEEMPHCAVLNGDELGVKRLFDKIAVDKDLCLSVTLNMVPQNELSSLIKYLLTTNALTRILYYYRTIEEKYISDGQAILGMNVPKTIQNTTATHFVSGISSGMLVIVVLRLPSKDESYHSTVLHKVSEHLAQNTFNPTTSDARLLDQFTFIKMFSNLSELRKTTKLSDLCQKITDIKPHMSQHHLLKYTLRPMRSLPLDSTNDYTYFSLAPEIINQIEQHLVHISCIITTARPLFAPEMQNSFENLFKNQFNEVQQQISIIKEAYESRITEIRKLVCKMRSGASSEQIIAELQIGEYEQSLQKQIDAANGRLIVFEEKLQLIESFRKKVEYWDVNQIVEDNSHDLETIRQQLVKMGKQKCIFCSDDKLEKPYSPKWNEFYKKLSDAHKKNPQLKLIYADFSFCSCQLSQMEILPSKDTSRQQNSPGEEQPSTTTPPSSKLTSAAIKPPPITSQPSSSFSEATPSSSKKIRLDPSNQPTIKFKNVLLLGESGVGKSTFINAIVNYLAFESLEQARSGEPIVLMPVSFLMTVGDTFEEKIVRFGGQDPNEDHNQSGQSVTQHCRAYVFTIGTQTKIRLIDTPGMGDTRGLDQDDRNMQHILSYINNLSHLDAICILLKPNEARLNVVLRSYFSRLLGFLGENVRNNIIFCFTNTRTTFFAPGNTGPLLRKMLESHSIKNIPFKKANTFCFDSESFRYLVALLDKIEFDDYQEKEYKQSWMASVNESNRLLQYISRELKSYPREDWQSMEHAYFQITQLIRPMLETIRNTMRNVILLNQNFSKSLIKLQATHVPRNSGVCLNRKNLEFLGRFWIIPDKLHVFSNQCNNCPCDLLQHSKVDYVLTYEPWTDKQKPSSNDMKTNLDRLKQILIEFVSIFKDVVHISQENDPILAALNRIIDEETDTCSQKGRTVLNSNLCDDLKNLRKQYEKTWTISSSHRKLVTLPEVYKQIKKVSETDTISEQLEAIKQTQKIYMDEHEKQIP